MPKPYRKFCTAHKFGKKREKSTAKRYNGAGISDAHLAQDGVATEHDPSDETPTSPPVFPAASDGVGDRQSIRKDTTFLTSADRAQQQKVSADKISSLSATSVRKRKLRTLATAHEDSDPSAATYRIVYLSAINKLLERTAKCPDMQWDHFY
ncbi:hypothetical protein MRX96_046642 [Rhipicephalus microplus]